MKIKALIILSLLFVFSCKTKVENTKNMDNKKTETSKMTNLEWTLIAKGNLHGSGEEGIEKENLVITNTNDWNSLLQKMDSVNEVSKGFSETNIDFSKYTVIAVFDSVKGSGGHKLEVDVASNSKNLVVTVTNKGPNGMATSVMTQPYYIVKIEKAELPIVFE